MGKITVIGCAQALGKRNGLFVPWHRETYQGLHAKLSIGIATGFQCRLVGDAAPFSAFEYAPGNFRFGPVLGIEQANNTERRVILTIGDDPGPESAKLPLSDNQADSVKGFRPVVGAALSSGSV